MDYSLLEAWVNINSGSRNPDGLARIADALTAFMEGLPGVFERIKLPAVETVDGASLQPGDALRLRFNPDARVRVLFSGHMDTVFDKQSPFQKLEHLDDGRIRGPGVADMKGGLFVMLQSVRKFLDEDSRGELGGEILINADEEIGSPGSMPVLKEAANWSHVGLVFESALPGGELVRCRKGTGTFKIVCRGKAAHTGRDFDSGRNAVVSLAVVASKAHQLNSTLEGVIVNVANFQSPGPVNVVPEYAETWLNIRIDQPESIPLVQQELERIRREAVESTDGIQVELRGGFQRMPKVENPQMARLHEIWNEVESSLGLPLSGKRDTGGSSDGNVFAAEGLPHLDGVGIVGGNIHSDQEYAWPDSIDRQVDKTVGFLRHIADDPQFLNNLASTQ